MSQARIIAANREELTSPQIAEMLGYTPRYVRKVRTKLDLPRPPRGAQKGEKNHGFVSGRRIDHSGYVLVTAPEDHPNARKCHVGHQRSILEHRLVAEKKLGRYLSPKEVVDHIDGLTLHNDPSNLRVFPSNGHHLRATIAGQPHKVSRSGKENISAAFRGEARPPVDTYRQHKARGEIRLHQILLAALKLGIDSPFLLGTHRHLERAGIDWKSHTSLERALDALLLKWEQDLQQ